MSYNMAKTTTRQDQIESFRRLELARKVKEGAEKLLEQSYKSKLLRIFDEASAYKETISSDWAEFITFLRGKSQWPARRPKHKVSAVINFLIENIERKTALLTDTKPIPKVTPRSDQFQDTADIINDLMEMIFEDESFGQANCDLVDNAQVFGSGFLGCLFDKDADNGRGDICVTSYDPRAVYVDPIVRKSYLLHLGEYVILEDIWSLEKAKDMFPKRADSFVPEESLSTYTTERNRSSWTGVMDRVFRRPLHGDVKKSEIPRVYVRDFYLRDRSGDFNNNSRKTVMVGNTLAADGHNPYNDGEFPIDMLHWHVDFNSSWGWGDVELLRNPQELSNKIIATIIENIVLMSNAIWVGDSDALTKADWLKLNNAPGTYVKKRPGRELRREAGVALPEYVLKALEYVGVSSEKISGMVDVMRGIRTGQVSSGVGIESLQMMAQALIRLRARALENVHARFGRKVISRVFQFYKPDKIFEVLNLHDDDRQQIQEKVTELIKPIPKRRKDAWTDIIFRIEPGSSLGLAKTQKQTVSLELHKRQAIDDRALLDDMEYPHRNEVLKRVEQKRQDEANKEVPPRLTPGKEAGQFSAHGGVMPGKT